MKKLFSGFVFVAPLMIASTIHGQVAPSIEWAKCFGGNSYEKAYAIQQTADSGFIVGGYTHSDSMDVSGNNGGNDYWIVKLNGSGSLIWQKCLGGSSDDEGNSILQTSDSGYVIAGYANSSDGNVTGNHGSYDFWIVQLDMNGNIIWQKCLGGTHQEVAESIKQTDDGGFIIAGYTKSDDEDVLLNHGWVDYWIVKLDAMGNLAWQKTFGGTNYDQANDVQKTTDGGFIVAGYSQSSNADVTGNHGNSDYWIVKLDSAGNLMWQKSLGGSNNDEAYSIQQTEDGSFVIAGYSNSNDGDATSHIGNYDAWVVKLDVNGNLVWQHSYGGAHDEYASSIRPTFDKGFILVGRREFTGGSGDYDYWVVKLDSSGYLQWQSLLGGSDLDYTQCVQQTLDSGFIVAGYSYSNDEDVTGNHGQSDYWIVKLSPETSTAISSPSSASISLHPNPVQNLLTIDLAMQAANATIRVYDLQGRIIAPPTISTNTRAQLNTTNLRNGFYTLQITNNKTGETEIGKFVKAN